MLSFKYVMAKSKELKLEISSVVNTVRGVNSEPAPANANVGDAAAVKQPTEPQVFTASGAFNREGEAFLAAQSDDWSTVLGNHERLLHSGEELGEELSRARKRLQDQVESEAYVTQHFHEIARVRERISDIRGLIEKITVDVLDVEDFLMLKTEEYMAAQNASFVRQQEQELERFEARILEEKEDRTQQLLEARRHVLEDAFQKDLQTYQTVVAYQGTALTKRAMETATPEESLEAVDLVVTTDAAQLEAFYDTEDDDDDPLKREEEEEEKEDEKEEKKEEEVTVAMTVSVATVAEADTAGSSG